MQTLVAVRPGWRGLALALWLASPLAHRLAPAAEPAASSTASSGSIANPTTTLSNDDPRAILDRGLDLERRRQWKQAQELYQDARGRWPLRAEFDERRRLCEMHLRLARRYQDQSFRNVLLHLSDEKAYALYDELIERIEGSFVDRVALSGLIRGGFDSLEVALRDPRFAFLALNARGATPDRIAWLRDQLRARREAIRSLDTLSAHDLVVEVCGLARQSLGIPAAAIVMEFVFGSCEALKDDYSAYLTPDKLDDMFAIIDGNFVGLGVELKLDPEGLRLVGVIRNGPAAVAGLVAGDRIVAIAGKSVRGLGLDEAAGRLQGSEGSRVAISVLRSDGAVREYPLVRRHVEVESVTLARMLPGVPGVGYVQLSGFQKTSAEELDRAIATLRRQGMSSLVLDLRGNPGGLLNVAVDIADRFVDSGVIVSTRGRAAGQSMVYRARPDKPYAMPVVVLIDRDSASASEILAGALQELHRAEVVGDRASYGKGSVQSIFELKTVPAGLKLTTAKFFSPTDRPYHKQGVVPDLIVASRAKPAPASIDGEEGDVVPADLGDPATDPVLAAAVRRFQRPPLTRR